jgi:dihydropyrimidinase
MNAQFDSVLKGGIVVTGRGLFPLDVAIQAERIAKLDRAIPRESARTVFDLEGKYVLPGILDVHSHPLYEDDFESTSLTAAWGGTTTMIHYAYAFPGNQVIDTIKDAIDQASSVSYLDFGLHLGLFKVDEQFGQIPEAFSLGVRTFKMFMTYAKLGRMTSDYYLAAAMDIISSNGGMAMVHAENGLATDYLEDKFNREGIPAIKAFARMRPAVLEAEAINRAIAISQVCNCPLYIPHVSAGLALDPIRHARDRGHEVYAETCPQYLVLTEKDLFRWGPLAKIGPPLRTPEDQQALWKALSEGVLDVVASDHAPKGQKPDEDFFEAGYGSPQAETLLNLTYHFGVNSGRITLPRLVEVLSELPARIFGLYPKKGTIQEGSDADLVVFDPTSRHLLSKTNQHSRAGYTLYEGYECIGWPYLTFQRGRIVLNQDRLMARPGDGQYLRLS